MSYIPAIYNDAYDITVPSRHRFNGKKFSKLLQYLRCSSFSGELDFLVSSKVRYRDVLRSHADDYVQRVATGTL